MRVAVLIGLLVIAPARAEAWGCDGHRAIAILAERYAKPSAVAAAKALLAAHPIDPALNRYCGPLPADPIADAATWPDDFRTVDPSTGAWHYVDFPLAAADAASHLASYCPSDQCAVAQIVRQYAIAKTSSNAAARATALRYLIHLIGDLHQPLHAMTNGDRGGNCVPVTYFGQAPQADASGGSRANLHGIWDTQNVTLLMQSLGAATPSALATKLDPRASPSNVHAQMPTTTRVLEWAAQSNALAKSTVYGKLPKAVPVEPASQFMIASCDDNNHVAQRMLALNEVLGAEYDAAARPVVSAQLRDAAKRLAETLDALFAK